VFYGFVEAVHLQWTPPEKSTISPNFYTILRMFPGDSVFDIFTQSQYIPADTLDFYDNIDPSVFPASGSNFGLLQYKIFALDSLGRPGDTSDVCSLRVIQQPALDSLNLVTNCIQWSSNADFGGPKSYCTIWKDDKIQSWTSNTTVVYPPTDQPAIFTACLPDSLKPLSTGRWYYALFIDIGDYSHSVKTGFIDIP
jgi:hypothetical protein